MAVRRKLGEILVEAGAISSQQLETALEDQRRYGGRLGTILLDRRYITEKVFFQALSSQLKLPAIDFTKSTIPAAAIKLLPQEMIEKHVIFPVATRRTISGNVLVLAMADPTNVEVQDEVRFKTELKVEPALALESTLKQVIREYFYEQGGVGSYRMKPLMEMEPESYEIVQSPERLVPEPSEESQTPIIEPLEDEDEQQSNRPQLTRELKALLKLLAKKGIITQKEYLDEFKDT